MRSYSEKRIKIGDEERKGKKEREEGNSARIERRSPRWIQCNDSFEI